MPHCGHSATAPWQADARAGISVRTVVVAEKGFVGRLVVPDVVHAIWLLLCGCPVMGHAPSRGHSQITIRWAQATVSERRTCCRARPARGRRKTSARRCALVCVFPAGGRRPTPAAAAPPKTKNKVFHHLRNIWPKMISFFTSEFTPGNIQSGGRVARAGLGLTGKSIGH